MYKPVETLPGEQAQVDWGHEGSIEVDGQSLNRYSFNFQEVKNVLTEELQKRAILMTSSVFRCDTALLYVSVNCGVLTMNSIPINPLTAAFGSVYSYDFTTGLQRNEV